MKSAAALAAAALLIAPVGAQAQTSGACISRVEGDAVVRYMLPDIVTGYATRCVPQLSVTSYFARNAQTLAQRFSPQSAAAAPVAREALARSVGLRELAGLSDATIRELVKAGLAQALALTKPRDCGVADKILEALDPLPPANMARLLVAFLELGKERPGNGNPLRLCTNG